MTTIHPTATIAAFIPRFASKVQVADDGCWLWTAALDREGGYGTFMHPVTKRQVKAHRWAYEQVNGAIPDGLDLDHLCRVCRCVNPDHLEPVTHRENLLRGVSPVAMAAAATHCPADHPYSGANLYVDPAGTRRCRTCQRARKAANRVRNPEKYRAEDKVYGARYRAKKRAERQAS